MYQKGINDDAFYIGFSSFLSTEDRLTITKPIHYNNSNDLYITNISETLKKSENHIKKLNDFMNASFKKSVDVYGNIQDGFYVQSYKIGSKDIIDKTISSNSRESNNILQNLENLNEQGDGIRSAFAILSSLIVNNHSIFFIDEPEAFLHPPQARLLGNEIVNLSEGKQCFISTHNIDLIRGIIETKSKRIKIIKINREENINKFHLLDNDSIFSISNDKNLKYSNILNGLFYRKIVLCEDESDCKLYSTVLESLDSDLYQNTLFCAVGGKDQFKIVLPLLKKLNIDYSIIADIDLINDKDKLKQLVNSISLGDYDKIKKAHSIFLDSYNDHIDDLIKTQDKIKQDVLECFNEEKYMSESQIRKIRDVLKNISRFKILKSGGESSLPAGECSINYFKVKEFLNERNIYILPCGEIERFCLEIDAHGDSFVNELFIKYSDINDAHYDNIRLFLKTIF